MSARNLSLFLVALAFAAITNVASAVQFSRDGQLDAGQQTYFDIEVEDGAKTGVLHVGDGGNGPIEVYVMDPNEVEVTNGVTSGGVLARRWTITTPGSHRFFLVNAGDRHTGFSITFNAP